LNHAESIFELVNSLGLFLSRSWTLYRARPRYRLEELLIGMTPQEMRAAWDWGGDIGREDVV
jgi:hypothetical protein